jgi:hypothetical protein
VKTLARERDKAEILQRLRRLSPDCQRKWGTMSAHQAVCHLRDVCLMAMGDTAVSPATSFAQRTMIKWIALYAPIKWPPGIQTRPEVDQVAGCGTRPGDFAADVASLESLVHRLAAHTDWPVHPIFGRMSHAAWLRWGYLHLDHHLRQFGR